MDDAGLLAAFVEKRSEEAFRALIDRHVNMVYAVCRRQLRDEHWAEDVTQAVFVLLARKAAELPPKVVIGGWLYKTAIYACSNARQLQRTRSYHESRVMPMKDADEDDPVERAEMEGLLDEALMELSEAQREVLVLRFFENKPLTEVARIRGETLYATEKAHQTGLARLRKFLSKRGVTATAAVLVTVMAQQATYAAPAGLAAACSAAAMGGTGVSIGVTELVTRLLNHAARIKLYMGAGVAASCILLATTMIAATALATAGATPAKSPAPLPVIVSTALSPAEEATEVAALQATLRQVETALRQMDTQALAQRITFTNLRQGRNWEAMARVFEADLQLKQAAVEKLGEEAHALSALPTFGQRLDVVLPLVLPQSCRWRIETHAAVLQFSYKDGTRAGGALYFVRDNVPAPDAPEDSGRGWRLDAGRSLDIVLEGLSSGGTRQALESLGDLEQTLLLDRLDRLERAFRTVTGQIAQGTITSVSSARQALEKESGATGSDGRAFFHIALKFDEIEQARH